MRMRKIFLVSIIMISKSEIAGSSDSNTTSEDLTAAFALSTSTKIVFTFLVSAVFIVSMVGNSLVIYIVKTNQEMKSSTFTLIINLACADLMTTMVVSPTMIKDLFLGFVWLPGVLGSVLCKIIVYLCLVFLLGSIFSLTCVSVDRYLAVSRPLQYHAFSQRTKVVIPGIWLASVLIPLKAWLETYTFPVKSGRTYCYDGHVSIGLRIVVGICFLVPMSAMCFLYPIISWRLWKRHVPGENAARQQQMAHLMARKITKMMTTVVVVFFLCWSLQFVMIWFHPFASDFSASFPLWLIPFAIWLEILNCAMNPVIYSVFNESFKRGFNKFFCRKNSTGNFPVEFLRQKNLQKQN